jgi:hypothetical protein
MTPKEKRLAALALHVVADLSECVSEDMGPDYVSTVLEVLPDAGGLDLSDNGVGGFAKPDPAGISELRGLAARLMREAEAAGLEPHL